MPRDDEDDYFNEDFDLVDDEDDSATDEDSDVAEEAEADKAESDDADRPARPARRHPSRRDEVSDEEPADELPRDDDLDEFGRPKPVANYVVHVYEYKKFKRTIDRAFTPEEAEAFATEYNRTAKPYCRVAVAGKNDAPPAKDVPAQKAAG